MKERHEQIKKMTVRILIGNQPTGTGFVISREGLIATCFHVVEHIGASSNDQTQITYASPIEVEYNDGKKLPAIIHNSCQNQGFLEAISKDYCILETKPKDLDLIPLGSFADACEEANIHLCGYPLGINQPVMSAGMFSTKWNTNGYLKQGSDREVAWLDITMNKGNSGGPIVLMGKEPNDDKIIGVASFILNPFASPAEELIQIVQTFPGTAILMNVDFKKFATLIGAALSSNSIGVSGCISIDYLKSKLSS